MALIECVPNVSDGRRLDVIDALAAAIVAVDGVHLLDRSSDPTHNRSVFTFAGEAEPLRQAVLALFDGAIRAIDLRSHRGAHPRLGAVDVVPFIPISGATMADCVALARATAAEVASRFQLPVFCTRRRLRQMPGATWPTSGAASSKDSPRKWRCRNGRPDFGPSRPHPTAGAAVIGARAPLIAFNVNLATDRIDTAKAIAAAVRQSSGGLPFVKAIGVALEHRGLAQVSMNLTNYEQTSIVRAFEAVKQEAERRGTSVLESEIVGLVPEAALPAEPEQTLRLAGFSRSQVLERRLREAKATTSGKS